MNDEIAAALEAGNPRQERIPGGGLAIAGGALVVLGAVLPWVVVRADDTSQTGESGMMLGNGTIFLIIGILVAALGLWLTLGHRGAAPVVLVLVGGTVIGLTSAESLGEIRERVQWTYGLATAGVGTGIHALFAGGLSTALAGLMASPGEMGKGRVNMALLLLASLAGVVVVTSYVVLVRFSPNMGPAT